MSSYDEEVRKKASEYLSAMGPLLRKINNAHPISENTKYKLGILAEKIADAAARVCKNEAYGGGRTDGGAGEAVKAFITFLEGFLYALGIEVADGTYQKMLADISKQSNPEYKEYLRLKAIYEE